MAPKTPQIHPGTLGVIILTGGHSRRMGCPKWSLPFGSQTLLERTVLTCCAISEEIVIAASQNQKFPDLARPATILRDSHFDCGPLEGIRTGLKLLQSRGLKWAFVTACDVPSLSAEIAPFLLQQASGFEAVIPHRDDRIYGMTALYRCDLHSRIETLIQQKKLRVSQLASLLKCRLIPADSLRDVDPNLDSLENLNHPEQYLTALKKSGLKPPSWFPESLER